MRLRMRAATWWQHCHDTGEFSARVAQGTARRIDEQRLGELAVGNEGAVGARNDAHGQAGAARRLRAGDGEQQRVAGAVGRDTVEQQVVDRGREDDGFEMRAGQPGQRMELIDRIAVARADEPCRELVERAVGAGEPHGHELGREREGEIARGRAPRGWPARRRAPSIRAP
jgi:hypothetical protein